MTSDLAAFGDGVPGTFGVLQKPVLDLELVEAIQFIADRKSGSRRIPPPRNLIEFYA